MTQKKTILITGATDGIGMQTALELAQQGHHVLVHGRNREKSERVATSIRKKTAAPQVDAVWADLTDFGQIKAMAEWIQSNYDRLDVMINNAGVFENEKNLLPSGFERTFMVNHLAPFTLTLLLQEMLVKTPASRIVNVSSMAQSGSIDFDNLNGEKYFDPYNAYAVSKLENVLFTYYLAEKLKGTDTTVNCLHPGVVSTKLLRAGWGMGGVSLHAGAQNSIYVAVSPKIEGKTALYFVAQKPSKSAAISYDKKIQKRLWEVCAYWVK